MQLIVPTIPDPRKSESLRSAIDVALIAVVKSLRKAHPQIDWFPEDKQGQPDYASSIRKTFEQKVQKDIQPLSPYKKEDVRSIHAYIAFWEHFICGKPLTSLPTSFKHDDAVLKKYIELSGRELSKEEEQGQLWLKAHRSDQQWGRYHRLGKGLIFRYQPPPSEAAEPVTKLELLEQIVSSPQPPVASALVVTPHAQGIGMGSVFDRAERAVGSLPTADEQ